MSHQKVSKKRSVHVTFDIFENILENFINTFKYFPDIWIVWISLILRSGLDESDCRSQFSPFQNIPVCEMMKSHSESGLVIRLKYP